MRNQDGFTLLSMMLALSILTVTLFLATSAIAVLVNRFEDDAGFRKEVALFFNQTSRELHSSQAVSCSQDHQQLILSKDGEQIVFKRTNPQRLIRLVGGKGYDIVLQHVKSVRFQASGNLVSMQIVDNRDHSYYWIDQLYLDRSETNASGH